MRFSQVSGKFARNHAEVYNHTTSAWDTLSFGLQLANSGRWIGRSEDFYNRRVALAPQPIPSNYQVLKFTAGPEVYLIFGNSPNGQPNIQSDEAYLYEYTLLNAEVEQAQLVGLTTTTAASGVGGAKVETDLGTFPIAMDRYAGSTSAEVKTVEQAKINCIIPAYAGAKEQMLIKWRGESYVIREATLELNLTHLYCIKR